MDAPPANQDPNAQNPDEINETQTPATIPNEIISEILKRLPVKSLKRFCCVSKTWLSLISSPRFIKDHLVAYLKDSYDARRSLILTSVDSSRRFDSFGVLMCPVSAVFDAPDVAVTKLKVQSYKPIDIVGSCNGLVCLVVDDKEILLWNPSTSKSKKLPDFGPKTTFQEYDLLVMSYGLGYDEAQDDFKVVGGCSVFYGEGKQRETVLKVYSGKTGGWRIIEHFKDTILDRSCYFVNGKFHWTASAGLNSPRAIVSVDVRDYRYGRVPEPNYDGICSWTLGELNGYLCETAMEMNSMRADVWILKSYGVEKLWSKVFSLSTADCPSDLGVFIKPVVLSEDGDKVLCMFGPRLKLVRYDLKDRSGGEFELPTFTGVDVHVESLFAPNVNGEARPKIVQRG